METAYQEEAGWEGRWGLEAPMHPPLLRSFSRDELTVDRGLSDFMGGKTVCDFESEKCPRTGSSEFRGRE